MGLPVDRYVATWASSCMRGGAMIGRIRSSRKVLSSNSSTAAIAASLAPHNPQKNQTGQHFWLNLFLGRWLKVLFWCLRRNSGDYQAVGWECPRRSVGWEHEEGASRSLRFLRWSYSHQYERGNPGEPPCLCILFPGFLDWLGHGFLARTCTTAPGPL